MNYKVEIDGHTFEFRYSGTGSLDPWSGDYAHENNINLIVTSDVAFFLLVDGDDLYRMRGDGHAFIEDSIKTYDEAKDWLSKHAEHRGSLNEKIQSLKEYKENVTRRKNHESKSN